MDERKRRELVPEISGGPRRRSRRVDRQDLPAIADRERVERILLVHDFYGTDEEASRLQETDTGILRLIAKEGVSSGAEPGLRYKAIAALVSFPQPENLNALQDLAQFGEDFYVRGHALLALGQTAVLAHVATVVNHLEAEEPFERTSAARALRLIAERTSIAGVRAHAAAWGDRAVLKRVDEILTEPLLRRPATTSSPSKEERGAARTKRPRTSK